MPPLSLIRAGPAVGGAVARAAKSQSDISSSLQQHLFVAFTTHPENQL